MKQDNDADVKSAEVANSNVPGANDVSSADARENGASRNMTEFTVRFHWFSGSRSGCTYTGEVSVVAKTEEAAEAIVREDFSASFTDVVIAGVEKVEEFKDFFDDDAHGAVVEVEASEEKGHFCDVFVSAKGKNLEYNWIWGLMEAESEEDAKKQAIEDFESPFGQVQNRRVLTIGVLRTAVVGLLQTRRKDVEKYEIQSDYSRYWTQRS